MEKLAIQLAQHCYFGDTVLKFSTVKGKGRDLPAFDTTRMACLRNIIHKTIFTGKSLNEFELQVVPKIDSAISGFCKRARLQST